MHKLKLKLDEMDVETFEIMEVPAGEGTVKGNDMATRAIDTCYTGYCTACPPIHCY
jgi:hypothetical protein